MHLLLCEIKIKKLNIWFYALKFSLEQRPWIHKIEILLFFLQLNSEKKNQIDAGSKDQETGLTQGWDVKMHREQDWRIDWFCLVFGGQAVCYYFLHKARLPKQRQNSYSSFYSLQSTQTSTFYSLFQHLQSTIYSLQSTINHNIMVSSFHDFSRCFFTMVRQFMFTTSLGL